jgi:hypothetical protein
LNGSSDGKIRGSEIISRISKPLELFQLNGLIEAYLNARISSLGATLWSQELARFEIAKFSLGANSGLSLFGKAIDGFIQGGTVFFDANFNAIPDPGEPTTLTNRNGQFELKLSAEQIQQFDKNQDSAIDLSEGRLAMIGGIDSGSGLPFEGILTAAVGSPTITPLTSLLERIVRRSATPSTLEQAQSLISQKLSFSSFGYTFPKIQIIAHVPEFIHPSEPPIKRPVDVTGLVSLSDNIDALAEQKGWTDYEVKVNAYAVGTPPFRAINPETGEYESVIYEPKIDEASRQYLTGAQIQLVSEQLAAFTGKPINEILDRFAEQVVNSEKVYLTVLGSDFYGQFMSSELSYTQKLAASFAISAASYLLTKEAYNQIDYNDDGKGDNGYGFAGKTYNIYNQIFRLNGKMQVIAENLEALLEKIRKNELDITYAQFNEDFSTRALVRQLSNTTGIAVNVFPPQTANFSRTLAEDTPYTFAAADFPFTKGDPDDVLTSVIIETLPDRGKLKLGDRDLTAGAEVSVNDLNASLLTYTPDRDGFGTSYAQFSFRVTDGKFFTDAAHTVTLNVTPVNDAPTLSPIANISVLEDSTVKTVLLEGISAGLGENQPLSLSVRSDNPNLLANPTVTYRNGSTATLSYGLVRNGFGTANLTVRVQERGSAAFVERSFSVTVIPVNDAPTDLTLSNLKISENSVNNALVGRLSAIDPDRSSDTYTFSLSNDADGRFALVGNEIRVADASKLDYESQTSHNIQVRVTDSDSLFVDRTFKITLLDDRDFNISGTSGNDIIYGGLGGDIMRGNGGQDIFRYRNYKEGGDTITDFNPVSDDRLDLSQIYNNPRIVLGATPFDSYIKATQVGANTRIDFAPFANLSPAYFLPLAILENVSVSNINAADFIFS